MVLVSTLLIAGLYLTLHAQAYSTISVLSRLEDTHRISLAKSSITEELRASPAFWMATDESRTGRSVILSRDGRRWNVRLTDVEGLVDLYLAPQQVLALLPLGGSALARRREMALADMVPGARFATEEQTLARFGFNAAERARLRPLVTQRARTGEINFDLAPAELRGAAATSGTGDRAGGELAEVTILIVQ